MGVDKARVPFPGSEPMAVSVARVLGSICDRVVLVRRGDADGLPWRLDGREIEVIRDRGGDTPHPLNGVVAALRAARTERALIVPCDVPHLTAEDLRALDVGEACVATDGERLHPLVGVYPRQWLAKAEALARDGGRVHDFAAGVRTVLLPAAHLANFNTWADIGRIGPVRALLDQLEGVGEPEKIADGEVVRLAHRGVIDPEEAIRYARLLLGESP
jgi:molybdopterin-guanine dinucleotide biosynthesis protein A